MTTHKCKALTIEMLKSLRPMETVEFDTGLDVLVEYSESAGIKFNYVYCDKKRKHIAYRRSNRSNYLRKRERMESRGLK